MIRLAATVVVSSFVLAACAPVSGPAGGAQNVNKAYIIPPGGEGDVQIRMLDSINALRSAQGLAPLRLNAQLNAAAATHSRDMALQNRPWNFGSDGSSPLDRIRRVGYTGSLRGELISESFETELETLAAWMQEPSTRNVLMDPQAQEMGFSYEQEPTGKLWWTLVLATPATGYVPSIGPGGAAAGGS